MRRIPLKFACAALVAGALAIQQGAVAFAAQNPFSSSFQTVSDRANDYWSIYGLAEGTADVNGKRFGDNPAWAEWDSLKFAWTNYGGYRAHAMDTLKAFKINGYGGTTGAQANGYVWSWSDVSEYWPDDNAYHGGVGSYHFDQIARFVNAIYNHYMWTRDAAYLSTMLPKAEFVTDQYLLSAMQGASGVLIVPGAANNGTSAARPSTYMDQIKSGYKDAWINASFYTALLNMAELEDVNGNTAKRDSYQALADAFPARYDTAFWSGTTNRYAAWRDSAGTAHDIGSTYVNLEALARGLGSTDKANRVFDWLYGPAQATAAGAHTGSTDPYQLVVAPRMNTVGIGGTDWDGWSDPSSGKKAYGSILEDGGAALWLNYYDVMARLRYSGADDAFEPFNRMLTRFATDSHKLTFNSSGGRYHNDFNEDLVELGTNEPFPESGIAALPFLYGFMGVNANKNGLAIKPDLPAALVGAQATGVTYKSASRTIQVSRGDMVAEQPNTSGVTPLFTGDTLSQTFNPGAAFNEVGLFVGTYGSTNSAFTLQLDKQGSGGAWSKVATKRFTAVPDNSWVHMAFPDQAAGAYRISIYDVSSSGAIAWYIDGASTYSGVAAKNGTALSGDFAFRAFMAGQMVAVDQSTGGTADALNASLGQTFTSAAPFDRVSMRVGTYTTTNSGFTATLYQDVGGRWQRKQRQTFARVLDNSEVVMSFGSQPSGKYLLEITDKVGSIAWYRNSSDVFPGSGLYALTDGNPVSGDRWFKAYRGKYRIQVPTSGVNTVINAGETYTMTS